MGKKKEMDARSTLEANVAALREKKDELRSVIGQAQGEMAEVVKELHRQSQELAILDDAQKAEVRAVATEPVDVNAVVKRAKPTPADKEKSPTNRDKENENRLGNLGAAPEEG